MLREKTEKLIAEIDELMNTSIANSFTMSSFMDLDTDDLALIQKFIGFYGSSKELILEQAEQMDEINKKLDKILNKLERLENRHA